MDKAGGHFYIEYRESLRLFWAVQFDPDDKSNWAVAEEADSLDGLLEKCRKSGLEHLEGMERSAIERIRQWLDDRPVLDLTWKLWEGGDCVDQRERVGFVPPQREEQHRGKGGET